MSTLTSVQQAAYQRRSLASLKAKAAAMAAAWSDVDNYFESRLEELKAFIGAIETDMAGYIAEEKGLPSRRTQE
ncbi:MAG: hypothetical protein Q8M09_08090 [Pseudomonadota bacterium]|nr:hypothetical protein [Pseudomonadota bacterium]MDP1904188.1 hypothetical protein [Pseudomonadota bacterium]